MYRSARAFFLLRQGATCWFHVKHLYDEHPTPSLPAPEVTGSWETGARHESWEFGFQPQTTGGKEPSELNKRNNLIPLVDEMCFWFLED